MDHIRDFYYSFVLNIYISLSPQNKESNQGKRKLSQKPSFYVDCDECEKSSKTEQELLIHKKIFHTKSGQFVKKSRVASVTKDRPSYKILKTNRNSLRITVKKAVQHELDRSLKQLNENASLTSAIEEEITLDEV